jgi:hypothetical protein
MVHDSETMMPPMTNETLRVFIYDHTIHRGTVPSSLEIGEHFGMVPGEVRSRLASLDLGKIVVTRPRTGEIWMAGPFAAGPTQYRLSDGTMNWYANCAWAMFGITMFVGRPLLAEAPCADCGERVTVECDPNHPPSESQAVVHFLVPARKWYDDLGFT